MPFISEMMALTKLVSVADMEEPISKRPTLGNGKLCYLEIPAIDIARSAAFYERVFGWSIWHRGDGTIAFDDGVNEVSGTWVLDRPPMNEPGLLIYVMVDSVAETVDAVVAHGGKIL